MDCQSGSTLRVVIGIDSLEILRRCASREVAHTQSTHKDTHSLDSMFQTTHDLQASAFKVVLPQKGSTTLLTYSKIFGIDRAF